MERGSDRLALITGQLHSFDPSSPSSSSSSSSSSASHNRTYSESSMQHTRSDHYMIQESPSLKYKFKGTQNIKTLYFISHIIILAWYILFVFTFTC